MFTHENNSSSHCKKQHQFASDSLGFVTRCSKRRQHHPPAHKSISTLSAITPIESFTGWHSPSPSHRSGELSCSILYTGSNFLLNHCSNTNCLTSNSWSTHNSPGYRLLVACQNYSPSSHKML